MENHIVNWNAVKCVVLDLGGVLIDIDYQATEDAFVELGLVDFKERYSQLQQTSLFDAYEKGQISAQHFINKVLDFCPQGTSANKVVNAWNAMLGEFPSEKIELLGRLKNRFPLYMLSNTNDLHIVGVNAAWKRATEKEMSVFFNEIFLSFEIGKRKPDAETFLWTAKQTGFSPAEILFVDDSPQHIQGAQSIGMQTYYYKEAESFYQLFS